jgi:cadmium resistance protein CadD (predicted permease)
MNTITISLIFISVAIAFVATIISGLIKLIFFFKQKDTYRHILKFGLLGEVVGLLMMFAVWAYYRKEIANWGEPESLFAIPFYLMLVGQLTGLIVTFRNRQKPKSAF